MELTLDNLREVADEFDRRARDLRNAVAPREGSAIDPNSQLAAAYRGRARSYADAATTLRSRFELDEPKTTKKRIVVAYEGRETKETPARLLTHGSLSAAAEVPVVVADAELGTRPIGVARHMERTEEGSVSFEVDIQDYALIDALHPAILLKDPFNRYENGVYIYTEGEIKEIFFFQKVNAWGE
jgi:hypothetical protein